MKYNPAVVVAYFRSCGIPKPEFEWRFHPVRKWRFDVAFPDHKLYVEVQGGLFLQGRHSRGAGMLKDFEKWNAATELGWRGLWCQPKDLCTSGLVVTINRSLSPGCPEPDQS